MNNALFRAVELAKFYAQAQTRHQIHSPFAFELVEAVLEDDRYFYAFDDIAHIRKTLLDERAEIEIVDFGAGTNGNRAAQGGIRADHRSARVCDIARSSGSSEAQGRTLFRLTDFLKPRTILELGSSLGISALHLGTAARGARFLTLEGSPACASIAAQNLAALGLKEAEVVVGAFEQTLDGALRKLSSVDFVFFDGNHRREPTLRYFEACLAFGNDRTAFVFDDIYWSKEMLSAWREIQSHSKISMTMDFFSLGIAFSKPEIVEKRHFRAVPTQLKPWTKFF